jgi:RNA polymerase sigma-70 factor (ECF subfamily)
VKFLKRETYQNYSDGQLLELYQQKCNRKAIGVLYLRYEHVVKILCRKYLSVNECKDVVSAVFEKLLKQIQKEMPSNIGGWIYTVTKNTCLQELRSKKKDNSVDIDSISVTSEYSIDFTEDPERLLSHLQTALEQINEHQAYCIRQFYLEEKTYAAIVDESNYSLKEVKSHLQNGRRNLFLKMNQLKKEQ